MKFFDFEKVKPKNGQLCIVKERASEHDVILRVFPQPLFYYDDNGFLCHPRVQQWALLPDHVVKNPEIWKSEYRGDSLPARDCDCLVCCDNNNNMKITRFSARDNNFVWGMKDVVAFMEI